MSNLTNNRLNITATPAQITAVKTAYQTILTNLSFLLGLTTEERSSLPAIDVNNKTFTEDAISAGVNNAALLPAYVSPTAMQTDLTLFSQLDELIALHNQLGEKLQDTQLLAGSEAYVGALTLYKLFASAAEAGVAGSDAVYNQLKQRFAGQGGTGKTPTNPE
ncbi:hypothetical protein LUD75_16400 [Epilithonimonas sp. JDS]|uniref:hypothetical protein n=1 Tax=Epilithonimonas sp. JDS TaxID=2902797 RepID=UPI001E48326F|nr:hypothetical protein [Epilithonimonas sp. JDS]MCD9856306.1 hypothetical protein [Epilithonimonas sp. JDS]